MKTRLLLLVVAVSAAAQTLPAVSAKGSIAGVVRDSATGIPVPDVFLQAARGQNTLAGTHSDSQGRYAYRMQPQIAYWNLFCLAQGLLPLLGQQHDESVRSEEAVKDAQRVLEGFKDRFAPALERRVRAKLGLQTERPSDDALANRLFEVMQANRADFTLTFRNLARVSKHDASGDAPVRDLFLDRPAFDVWVNDYRARLSEETLDDAERAIAMNRVNPKFILRNHLAETAIRRAREKDFSEVERLAAVLRRPFDEQPEHEAYAALPPEWASSLEVSCSS